MSLRGLWKIKGHVLVCHPLIAGCPRSFWTVQAFSAVVEALLALDRLQRESGLVVRWMKNEDVRIHTFSSTARSWNLAVFCMNNFSFPFGGPRMWAYSFTRLPWTSRTWGTALDGWLFDARVRQDDSVMMPDSLHTLHTQRTISLLLKSSSPAAVAETTVHEAPLAWVHSGDWAEPGSGREWFTVCEILARKIDLSNFCWMFFQIDPTFQTASMHQLWYTNDTCRVHGTF